MKICPRCGVELDEDMNGCPLCDYTDYQDLAGPEKAGSVPDEQKDERILSDFVKLTRYQKRKLFWEISNIILFSEMLVTTMINVISARAITWSKYTITIGLVLFVNVTLFSFWRHRLLVLIGGSFLTVSLFLILLDLYIERTGWGIQLGIPLLFSLYFIIVILTIVIRLAKHHGFNILGCIFLGIGLLSLFTDGIISRYDTGEITFRWGLIVFVCIIPIVSILFYIYYRLNRGVSLRSFFNI